MRLDTNYKTLVCFLVVYIPFYTLFMFFIFNACVLTCFWYYLQDSENPKMSYVGVALTKDHAIVWISHMKILLGLGLEQLTQSGSKLDAVSGGASAKKLSSWLSFLIAFTSIKVFWQSHSFYFLLIQEMKLDWTWEHNLRCSVFCLVL